ncbi:MAG: conjugative transfer signal peptidase TraF [Longimicrobiaceae bacterium]
MNGRLRRARANLAVLREVCREWWVQAALLAVALLGAGVLAGFRVNVTRSYPLGLYRVVGDASAVERGSVVIVCLPPDWARFALRRGILGPGHCEGGSYGLGKMVLAVGGDVVELRRDRLAVNGVPVRGSRTLEQDSRGRPMPHYAWGRYALRQGEVWLYSSYHVAAFDSRYFGPVTVTRIQAVIRPVWADASPHEPTAAFRISCRIGTSTGIISR